MKSLLFIAAVIGFYLGVNYFSFTEGAVDRWTQKTQFPNIESAEVLCGMLTDQSQIQFTYVINKRKINTVPPTAQGLCDYYKQQAIPKANKSNYRITTKIISYERSESLPFNKAKGVVEINMGFKNDLVRRLEVELQRGFLGDFTILSIKGHDVITKEEKARAR